MTGVGSGLESVVDGVISAWGGCKAARLEGGLWNELILQQPDISPETARLSLACCTATLGLRGAGASTDPVTSLSVAEGSAAPAASASGATDTASVTARMRISTKTSSLWHLSRAARTFVPPDGLRLASPAWAAGETLDDTAVNSVPTGGGGDAHGRHSGGAGDHALTATEPGTASARPSITPSCAARPSRRASPCPARAAR